jgi:hypothetical protein
MPIIGKARAGLLLLLTAGPFLVFLFLYVFGKNNFELDRYPLKLSDILKLKENELQIKNAFLLMDTSGFSGNSEELNRQLKRISAFWEDAGSSPQILQLDSKTSEIAVRSTINWFEKDSVLSTVTAKGAGMKALPRPPRSFLFDKNKTLRGVYSLINSKSVDTLMLEYRILLSN